MAYRADTDSHNRTVELVNQLGIMLRTAQIHSINNIAVTSAITKFVTLINDLIVGEGSVVLELRGEYFYFNDTRIRYAPEYLLNFDFLVRELKRTELGTVHIKERVSSDDIRTLVAAIVASSYLQEPFDSICSKMKQISHIEIRKIEYVVDDDSVDVRKMVKKTYFNAVSYSKGVFNKIKTGEKVNLKRAKRVVTSLVNHIIEQEQIMLGMTAIKDYDEYTYHHSTNVSILSVALGQRLGMSRKKLIELGIVSLFHDLGKTDIPREVLNKPDKLTDEEWGIIRKHPQWGVRALLSMRELDELTIKSAIVSFEHHMCCNFAGYPKVTAPLEIDLYSRIVALADQYDAMTSSRVYHREPMSPDKAITEMMRSAGNELDPLLLKFFINMVGVFPIGTLVMLDSKEFAVVYENNQLFLKRPRVMLITNSNGKLVKGHIVDLNEKDGSDQYIKSISKTIDPSYHNVNLAEFLLN